LIQIQNNQGKKEFLKDQKGNFVKSRLNETLLQKIALETLRRISNLVADNNLKSIRTAYDHTCGKHHSEKNKRWIIDMDDEWLVQRTAIESEIRRRGGKIYAEVPTKSGFHLITSPFKMIDFPYSIDIHKDNPTNCYTH